MVFFFQFRYSVSGFPSSRRNSLRKMSTYRDGQFITTRSWIFPYNGFSRIQGNCSACFYGTFLTDSRIRNNYRLERSFYPNRQSYQIHFV